MRERRRGVRTIEGTVLPACRDRRQLKCHPRSVTTCHYAWNFYSRELSIWRGQEYDIRHFRERRLLVSASLKSYASGVPAMLTARVGLQVVGFGQHHPWSHHTMFILSFITPGSPKLQLQFLNIHTYLSEASARLRKINGFVPTIWWKRHFSKWYYSFEPQVGHLSRYVILRLYFFPFWHISA